MPFVMHFHANFVSSFECSLERRFTNFQFQDAKNLFISFYSYDVPCMGYLQNGHYVQWCD